MINLFVILFQSILTKCLFLFLDDARVLELARTLVKAIAEQEVVYLHW